MIHVCAPKKTNCSFERVKSDNYISFNYRNVKRTKDTEMI